MSWIHIHITVTTCPPGHCIAYCIWNTLSQWNLPLKTKMKIIFWAAFHVSVILSFIFPSSCFSSFLFFFFFSSTRPLSCWNEAAKLPIYISKCEERNSVMSSPSPPPAMEETLCETNWNWHRCVWGEDLWGLQEYFFYNTLFTEITLFEGWNVHPTQLAWSTVRENTFAKYKNLVFKSNLNFNHTRRAHIVRLVVNRAFSKVNS